MNTEQFQKQVKARDAIIEKQKQQLRLAAQDLQLMSDNCNNCPMFKNCQANSEEECVKLWLKKWKESV